MTNQPEQATALATTPVRQAQAVVARYAQKLLNDDKERADKFLTQLAVLGSKEPKLLNCTPESLTASLLACVHLDLIPNTPEGLAYIIPYKNNRLGRYEAQFQIGYKGLAQLAYRSGAISAINAELVFPEDTFDVDLGMRTINHRPDLTIDRTNYSKAVAVYAVATLPNGDRVFDVLSPSEIEKIRKTVKFVSTDSPWKNWEESMVKKTAIKRLTKILPQSATDNRLQYAAEWDSLAQMRKLKVADNGQLIEGKVEPPEISPEEEAQRKKEAAEIAANLKAQAESGSESQESENEAV